MISDTDQTHDLVQDGAQQGSGAGNGALAAPRSSSRLRKLGPRAARARATELQAGRDLPPEKLRMLKVTSRLLIHLENVSNRLYRDGELTAGGDPRVLLRTVQDLARQVKANLEDIFGDDPGDPAERVIAGD